MSDLINRQDAIDALNDYRLKLMRDGKEISNQLWDSMDLILQLPSAQSERQRGAWIEYIPEHGKCPFCGNQIDLLGGRANNFCGECGADMRGE